MLKPLHRVPPAGRRPSTTASPPAIVGKRQRSLTPPPSNSSLKTPENPRPPAKRLRPVAAAQDTETPLLPPLPPLPPLRLTLPEIATVVGVDEPVEAGTEPIPPSTWSTAGQSLSVAPSPSPMVLSDTPIVPSNHLPDHLLVKSERVTRKRSRSLTPPDHQPSPSGESPTPIIRPAVSTPRPPVKRARLEPQQSPSLQPISPRKRFGSVFLRKKRDRSVPISQEILLAQVIHSQSKGTTDTGSTVNPDFTPCQATVLRTAETAPTSDGHAHAELGSLSSPPAMFTAVGEGELARDTAVNDNSHKSVTTVDDLAEYDPSGTFAKIEIAGIDIDNIGQARSSDSTKPTVPLRPVQLPQPPSFQIGSSVSVTPTVSHMRAASPPAVLQLAEQAQLLVHPMPTTAPQQVHSPRVPSIQIGDSVSAISTVSVPQIAERSQVTAHPTPTVPLHPVHSPQAPSIQAGFSAPATSTVFPERAVSPPTVPEIAVQPQEPVHMTPIDDRQPIRLPSVQAASYAPTTSIVFPAHAVSPPTVPKIAAQPQEPVQAASFAPATSTVFPVRAVSSPAVPQPAKQSQVSIHPMPAIPLDSNQPAQVPSFQAGSSTSATPTVFPERAVSLPTVPQIEELIHSTPIHPPQPVPLIQDQVGSSTFAASQMIARPPMMQPAFRTSSYQELLVPTTTLQFAQSHRAPSNEVRSSTSATSTTSSMPATSPVPQPASQSLLNRVKSSAPVISAASHMSKVQSFGPAISTASPIIQPGPQIPSIHVLQHIQAPQTPMNPLESVEPAVSAVSCMPMAAPIVQSTPQTSVPAPLQLIIQPPYTPTIRVGSSAPSSVMPIASSSEQPPQHMTSLRKSKQPFSSNESRENRKTNLAKAMERLQRMPDALVVGIPLDGGSGTTRGSDGNGVDHDILMVDLSDKDEDEQNPDQRQNKDKHVPKYPPQSSLRGTFEDNEADNDVLMADSSDEVEEERNPDQRQNKGKHVPKYPPESSSRGAFETYDPLMNNEADYDIPMAGPSNEAEGERNTDQRKGNEKHAPKYTLHNRDAFQTYEHLINNPDAPCTNAALATVLEVVVDLKSVIETDLKTIMQTATPQADDNKKGYRGRKPALPKTTFQVRRQDESTVNLQRDVHQLAKELLNLPEDSLHVPTPEELRLFAKKHPDAVGPQINPFILDLASKGLSSPWNKDAASIFATEFLSRKIFLCTDRSAIQHAFRTYLMTLQAKYRKQQKVGTTNEAARIAELDNVKRNARYARRTYKRHRRCNALNTFKHIPGVDTVIAELEKFPVDTMSGDETEFGDDDESYLVKTRCEWRSKEADDLFEVCDALDLSTRFDSSDRPDKGRFPDVRIASHRRDGRPVPPRLPQNLYSADYKEGLTPNEREHLQMRPTFKFIIPKPLLQIAERYRRSTSRKIPPLPRNHPRLASYTESGTSLL